MTVNVFLVRMGGDDKGMAAFCPTHSKLVPDTVRFLWCNLPGEEGLAYLITQDIVLLFLLPACDGLIAGLRQKKLGGHCGRVTFV